MFYIDVYPCYVYGFLYQNILGGPYDSGTLVPYKGSPDTVIDISYVTMCIVPWFIVE